MFQDSIKTLKGWRNVIDSTHFFRTISAGGFSPRGLGVFTHAYAQISDHFPEILAVAISRLPTDEARLPIIQNLWDEHGKGNLEHSHRLAYARFAARAQEWCGDAYPAETINNSAICYVQGLRSLIYDAEPSAVLGVIWFLEVITPFEYKKIVAALRGIVGFDLSPDQPSLHFWVDHVEHDPEHIQDLSVAVAGLGSQYNERLFQEAASNCFALEKQFWDTVLK